MRLPAPFVIALLAPIIAPACKQASRETTALLPSDGVVLLDASLGKGSFEYSGDNAPGFELSITSRANASDQGRADSREQRNSWSHQVSGDTLNLRSRTPSWTGQVDMQMMGPRWLSMDITGSADLDIDGVVGFVKAEGNSVRVTDLTGGAQLSASTGDLVAEVAPPEPGSGVDGTVNLEARSGGVDLMLKAWGDYTLVVDFDPEEGIHIEEDLLQDVQWSDGHLEATLGNGGDLVVVDASGGVVWLGFEG